jgi:hypothetical protein
MFARQGTLALEPLCQPKRGVLERTKPSFGLPGRILKSQALRDTTLVKVLNPSH